MGSFDTTIGTLLLGIFLNTFLYGLVSYQFAAYYRMKFNDRRAIKLMVFFLFILDTFHTAATIYMAWYYTVVNYDNPAALQLGLWPYQFTPIGTALAACVTQIYLGYRIWRLTDKIWLYVVVVAMAIPSFIMGAVCSIESAIIDVLSDLPRITPLVIAWLSTQVVVDTFITVTLIITFSRWRGGFRKTDTVLNRLTRGAIQTGLFAGIFSIGDLISFIVVPNTNLYGMFAIPIGRIYTNTLMDTLLTRESLQAQLAGTYEQPSMFRSIGWAPASNINNGTQATSSMSMSMSQSQSIPVHAEKSVHEVASKDSRGKEADPVSVAV